MIIILEENMKWTEKEVRKEAQRFSKLSEFRAKSNGAFKAAKRLGIYEEIISHMERKNRKNRDFWNFENIQKEAKNYKTKKEFYTNAKSAYQAARCLGILSEVCSHMKDSSLVRSQAQIKWTNKKIFKKAKKYKTKKEFRKGESPAYQAAIRNSCLEEISIFFNGIKVDVKEKK